MQKKSEKHCKIHVVCHQIIDGATAKLDNNQRKGEVFAFLLIEATLFVSTLDQRIRRR